MTEKGVMIDPEGTDFDGQKRRKLENSETEKENE
jgi:hypothetical protein